MSGTAVRVLVRGEGGVMICRDYEVACGMACLSSTHAAIEEFRARFGAEPTDVVVDRHVKDKRRGVPRELGAGDVSILNLCGKVSHVSTAGMGIFNAGSLPLVSKIKDGFGVRLSTATVYGNFVTSPYAHSTLFRGCKRCGDVQKGIELIFRAESVHEVVIHMVVVMTVLPHAVAMAATQVRGALYAETKWRAETPPSLEDNVYMQPVQLTCGDKKVLVHVYATGAIFFFITCTEKTVMRADSEAEFVRLCREIYACVARVC
jgi:hypothetical protein